MTTRCKPMLYAVQLRDHLNKFFLKFRATRLADTSARTTTPATHTWKGMGRRRTASRPVLVSSLAAVILQIALVTALVSRVCSQPTCTILRCSYTYESDTDPLDPGPNPEYCRALLKYQRCVDRISPGSCRGDLHYHSTKTVIPDLQRNYNCAEVLRADNNPQSSTSSQENTDSESPDRTNPSNPDVVRPPWFETDNIPLSDAPNTWGSDRCRFRGQRSFRHCGLFGDPHLRTFDDVFQTCKVAGAWPLIYNEYLTAQVTNVPLIHGAGATATSKLTVIIKPNENGECAEHKQYQATTGNLPAAFVDGTSTSGSEQGVVIVEVIPGEHVEIHIKYIATLLVIRKVGRYITFAVRMPEELIHFKGAEDMQLCVKGCPYGEQIDYATFLSKTARDRDYKALRQDAIAKCRQAKVIDVYLDSCVFDLLTTGDANFTRAAQSALTDVRRLHPNASFLLRDRTSVFENDSFPGYRDLRNGAPPRTCLFHNIYVNLTVTLLSIFISSYTSSWCHVKR